ncbi:hypothetical protein [Hymenobacter sp. B81]
MQKTAKQKETERRPRNNAIKKPSGSSANKPDVKPQSFAKSGAFKGTK